MKITLNIDTTHKLSKEQQAELIDGLLAYAEEIIDDLTFLDEVDSEEKPKAKPKKAEKAKKKGGK
jgi:hypothetical protein